MECVVAFQSESIKAYLFMHFSVCVACAISCTNILLNVWEVFKLCLEEFLKVLLQINSTIFW